MAAKSIFTDLPGTLASLRRDRLASALALYAPDADISDDYLTEKLAVAERTVGRTLRVPLVPTEIVGQLATDAERTAAEATGMRVIEEPGYDYTADMFSGDRWGRVTLRHRPIIAVHTMRFVYPTPSSDAFVVPPEWIRMDRKYGVVQLVPVNNIGALPLTSFLLSVLNGGAAVPFMVQVCYRAGLANAADDWPDLVDVVKKAAVLSLVEDLFMPQSGSTSQDGLSQSISLDASKYQDTLDRKLRSLSQAIHGIQIMCA